MLQRPPEPFGRQRGISIIRRSNWLRRHPVLTPFALLGGSAILSIACLSSDSLFPILDFLGVPSIPFTLSIATVLGIAGILASIIGILERIDQYGLQTAMFPNSKEHSYVNRN